MMTLKINYSQMHDSSACIIRCKHDAGSPKTPFLEFARGSNGFRTLILHDEICQEYE
jgi:hypothetical protein